MGVVRGLIYERKLSNDNCLALRSAVGLIVIQSTMLLSALND